MPTFEQDESTDAMAVDDRRSERDVVQPGVPRLLADRYEVLEEIGSGATAITYRGHDRRLNRNVAIKILRHDHALDANYVERFEREGRAAASISHGNVVDVYDFGEQDDALYIVMQFIDGEDLKHVITRLGALDSARARQFAAQILAGLAAIHAAGIIHRDIKPQNVLISRDGIARVTDFGVAQAAVDVGLTTAGTTVGTAAYMAPEQAQAGDVGEATDIYAVGVVLYEMLTGRMPFTAPTPVAMMLAHIQQDPIPPSKVAPDQGIPADLDWIVMQAMAKDPADRFRSAGAMSRALAVESTVTWATTVLAAAPLSQASRTLGAQRRDPMPDAWPADPKMGSGAQPAAAAAVPPRRVGSRVRGAVGGLLLVLLLATAVGAAFMANQLFGDDNGNANNPTPSVPAFAPLALATLTPTSAVTETPDIPATDEPTATQVPTATRVPTEQSTETTGPTEEPTDEPTVTSVPTEEPTSTEAPTAAPAVIPIMSATDEPTATEAPTEVPTAIPTEIPTAIPTAVSTEQPTIAPAEVVPTANAQRSNVANRAAGQPAENPGISQASRNPGQITIDSDAWQGDGVETATGQNWMVVGPGEEATAAFDVNGTPSARTFEVSIAIAAVDTQQVPLRILLNDTEMVEIADPLPTISSSGDEQTLGNLILTIPSAILQEGRNEITIVNSADTGSNGWAQSDDDDEGDDDDDDEGSDDSGNGNGNGNRIESSAGQSNNLESRAIVLAEAVISLES